MDLSLAWPVWDLVSSKQTNKTTKLKAEAKDEKAAAAHLVDLGPELLLLPKAHSQAPVHCFKPQAWHIELIFWNYLAFKIFEIYSKI